jgi:hypothetical protein
MPRCVCHVRDRKSIRGEIIMAVNHPVESHPRRHSLDVSHWDQTSREDFFHPDWDDDAPPAAERSVIHRASLRPLQSATVRLPPNRPIGLLGQTVRVAAGGGVVMGTVVLIAAAFMLSKVAGLLSNY